MNSYRQQVSDALKLTLDTIPGVNAFNRLDRPLQPSDLPAIIIYTPTSKRGRGASDNTLITREVTVHIEAAVESTPALALDAADALAATIETSIERDPSLGHVADNTVWQQTTLDVSSFGQLTLGVVLLEYTVTVLTQRMDDDWIGLEQPLPTSVTVHGEVTPRAYVQPLSSAREEDPAHPSYWGDPVEPVPATIEQDVVAPARAPQSAMSTCVGDSCDIPAWEGDQ